MRIHGDSERSRFMIANEGFTFDWLRRLDPFRLDIGLVLFAEVTLKAHGTEALARFDAAIAALPQIVEASHVSGAFDYLLKVVVADMPEWARIGEQLTAADVGADRINTHVLLRKPRIFVGYPIADG